MKTVLQQVFRNWLLSTLFYTAILTALYLVVCGIWYTDLFSLYGYVVAIIAGLFLGTITYLGNKYIAKIGRKSL
ncbi:MAG: hypothetical protein R2800_08455 [Flavipsychrobacter sp.]